MTPTTSATSRPGDDRRPFPAVPATLALLLAAALLWSAGETGAIGAGGGQPEYTTDFPFNDCQFQAHGWNPWFPLQPGHQLYLEGEDDGAIVTLLITVLPQTRRIDFEWKGELISVNTRVVEEREYEDDELVEVSRNFFARCRDTDSVYYFGEDVDIYEDGEIVSHDGAWLAGVDGATPGLIMPGTFLLGSRYFQEMAPDIAMDRAENAEMGLRVVTPAGTFDDCVLVDESSAIEPGTSEKIYAPGIGLIQDDELQLVGFGSAN
ncbi:MAG: hypothetical protein ACYTGG_07845 [Planctomycetota bacterium]|jgi:hypothetical protein